MEIQFSLVAPNITSVRKAEKPPGTHHLVSLGRLILLFLALFFQSLVFASEPTHKTAQTALHILDYVSVDYGGTVFLEKVINQAEYQEQLEFSKRSIQLLGDLPDHPRKLDLVAQARKLTDLIQAKSPSSLVSKTAQQLRQGIINEYRVSVAPNSIPKLEGAAELFSQNCAKCHGAEGRGDGPKSKTLSPKPANFHDNARMSQRNVYGLYNTVTLGVSGTAMESHPELTNDERWSLAFYLSNLRISDEYIERGRKSWEDRSYRGPAPNLTSLTSLTSNEISVRYGEQTNAVYTFLRSKPNALTTIKHSTLLFATEQLDQALSFYQSGDQSQALSYSVDAYLEGFDPVEISLDNLDKKLRIEIEHDMWEIRHFISEGRPVLLVKQKIIHTKALLRQADELLRAGKLSSTGAFLSSFFVLLREGTEGMLMLAAIITFVVRSGQRQLLKYIHAGWISAMLLGTLTWVAATWLVEISGAQREVTEGVTALITSVMLIYVGFWLHDKAHILSWSKFLDGQVNMALERKTIWLLTLISFFAIYREIFESVLFYQALWVQVNDTTKPALWIGIFAAALILVSTGWVLFKFCIKLPLGLLFAGTSLFLGLMAVIFAGQGVSALQDANIITSSPVHFLTLPMLSFLPTVQTLLAQVSVICILAMCYLLPFRRQSNAIPAPTRGNLKSP
ncbi:MAG: cytochrome c/FTR1 family iron permease [Gallionella sp.]